MGKTGDHEAPPANGKGVTLASFLVGGLAGAAIYLIGEYWIDKTDAPGAPAAVMVFVMSFAAAWLLTAERTDHFRPIAPAALIAALLAGPTWWLVSTAEADSLGFVDGAPLFFWFSVAAPLAAYLMATIAKAILETGVRPAYPSVFFHGLTLPLIAGGSGLFAGLAMLLLFAWGQLLKSMGVEYFAKLFEEAWFILPFVGAIGGLCVALMRGQQSVLGALRFILLLASRLFAPIMAIFSVTFLLVLIAKGPGAVLDRDFLGGFYLQTSGVILFLAFAGMLIFNGVYQNGEDAPPLWLRASVDFSLATFPIYVGLAGYALLIRIGEYGLTPPRIIAAAMTLLAFAYSIVCIAGLVTELNWRSRKWMPLVAPLNLFMAGAWVATLILISSPLANPWAISAASQEKLVTSGKIAPEKFDFGYLKFRLGPWGESALDRLAGFEGENAGKIRAGVMRAQAATNWWDYNAGPEDRTRMPDPADDAEAAADDVVTMSEDLQALPLNPDSAPESDDTAAPISPEID